jgi:hypothetical protein
MPDQASLARGRRRQWTDPPQTEERFQFAIGSDFFEEFVASHSPSDMLRELVQNEYDAGGSRLEAFFGPAGLRVTGNGNPIDAAGWRRLSVMISTGPVAGAEGANASGLPLVA